MGIFAHDGKLAQVLTTLGNLMVLNILTLLCCIPVVTAGPAMAALFAGTLRIVRKEEGSLIAQYFTAFCTNFKQAVLLWLLTAGCVTFMAFDIYLLGSMEGPWGQVYRLILLGLSLLFSLAAFCGFALMARFDNTFKNTFKNAWILALGKPFPAVLMLALMFLSLGLPAISARFLPLLFLLGVSGPAYLSSFYFTSLFHKFEGQPER